MDAKEIRERAMAIAKLFVCGSPTDQQLAIVENDLAEVAARATADENEQNSKIADEHKSIWKRRAAGFMAGTPAHRESVRCANASYEIATAIRARRSR